MRRKAYPKRVMKAPVKRMFGKKEEVATKKTAKKRKNAPKKKNIVAECTVPEKLIDNSDEYEVDYILAMRTIFDADIFFIKWTNYPYSECSWEPRYQLNSDELLSQFEECSRIDWTSKTDEDIESIEGYITRRCHPMIIIKFKDVIQPIALNAYSAQCKFPLVRSYVLEGIFHPPLVMPRHVLPRRVGQTRQRLKARLQKENPEPVQEVPTAHLPEYEVEYLLRSLHVGTSSFYLVKWKGYPYEACTLEPGCHLEADELRELLKKYEHYDWYHLVEDSDIEKIDGHVDFQGCRYIVVLVKNIPQPLLMTADMIIDKLPSIRAYCVENRIIKGEDPEENTQ